MIGGVMYPLLGIKHIKKPVPHVRDGAVVAHVDCDFISISLTGEDGNVLTYDYPAHLKDDLIDKINGKKPTYYEEAIPPEILAKYSPKGGVNVGS